MKINRFFFFAVATALLAGAVASCKGNIDPEQGDNNSSVPKTTALDPQVVKLTESALNGTTIQSATTVAGVITDKKTGKGIPGVAVTDGYSFVKTDANGVYQMKTDALCRKVYYTIPAAYKVNLDSKDHLPCFFSPGDMRDYLKSDGKCRVDFVLDPLDAIENNFTLCMIGDPQCSESSESSRYKNETISDIKKTAGLGTYPNIYAITLGDITHDCTNMWPAMKATMSNVKVGSQYIPFFNCIGNHVHNSLESDTSDNLDDDYRATQRFTDVFGPTDYSFDRGKMHIIVMDDIIVSSRSSSSQENKYTWNYDSAGGFTAKQWAWLQQDIANVEDKANKVCIVCCHIQFRGSGTNYKGSLMNAMKQFGEAHIMIGHTHYPQNYIQNSYKCVGGQAIYEHIHGAACGAWWAANSNVTGAPNGYSLYSVSGGSIKDWVAKGAKNDFDYQLRVYNGNQTYTGTKGYRYNWYNTSNKGGSSSINAKGYPKTQGCFVAEVWDDDFENWSVEFWQNGKKVGDFTHIPNGNCCNIALTSFWFNEKSKNTDTWTNTTCSHYWYYQPASAMPNKEENWEVRAVQKIPTNPSMTHTYTCSKLTTDYSEF